MRHLNTDPRCPLPLKKGGWRKTQRKILNPHRPLLLLAPNFRLWIHLDDGEILFTHRWWTGLEKVTSDSQLLCKKFSFIGDIHSFDFEGNPFIIKLSLSPLDLCNKVCVYRHEELIGMKKIPPWGGAHSAHFQGKLVDDSWEFEDLLRKPGIWLVAPLLMVCFIWGHLILKALAGLWAFVIARDWYFSREIDEDDQERESEAPSSKP